MSEQYLPMIPCQGIGIYAELLHPVCSNDYYQTLWHHIIFVVLTGSTPKYPHFSNSSCSSSELTDVCLSVSDNCFISLVVSEI